MTKPTVSVLLLTWNSRDVVGAALTSIWTQSCPPDEVIVVDNASTDGTPEMVEEIAGGRARLVLLTRNLGYSGGFNQALRLAGGDFLLLLNPDVRLDPDFIEQALPGFDDPRVGIVAGLLLRPDRRTVDSSGLFLARSRKTLDRGFASPLDESRDRAGPVLSACGAAPFYRRAMVEDIADGQEFFDSSYFAFREDLEVGWRAWRAGWKAVCRPEAVAIHLRSGGASRGRLGLAFARPPALTAHIIKNRHLSLLRHDRLGSLLLDLPWWLPREIAYFGACLLLRPQVLVEIWQYRSLLARAWRQRKHDRRRRGQWGVWSDRVPARGLWKVEGESP